MERVSLIRVARRCPKAHLRSDSFVRRLTLAAVADVLFPFCKYACEDGDYIHSTASVKTSRSTNSIYIAAMPIFPNGTFHRRIHYFETNSRYV